MNNFHLWMRKVNPSAIFMQAGGVFFFFLFWENSTGKKNMLAFDSWEQILRWMPMIDFSPNQGLEPRTTCGNKPATTVAHPSVVVCSLCIVSSPVPVYTYDL